MRKNIIVGPRYGEGMAQYGIIRRCVPECRRAFNIASEAADDWEWEYDVLIVGVNHSIK